MALVITVEPHPLLEPGAFVVRLAEPLGERATPPSIAAMLDRAAPAPLATDDAVRTAVRDLLRAGGFKPAGRSKPASEYLHAAAAEGRMPQINPLVDACNAASLHSGLPISLIDLDRASGALRIGIAPAGTSYQFNPSGQVIDASGLVCLRDGEGPTGTPVKDAQRTKTSPATRVALAVVWGTSALPGRTARATTWYRELYAQLEGAAIEDVELRA